MENYYIASICLGNQIGSERTKQLINFFGSAKAAWEAKLEDLNQIPLSKRIINSFINLKQAHPNCPEELFNYCEERNINLCSIRDSKYPEILKNINDAPAIFYYQGDLQSTVPRIAIVGTRRATRYGIIVAERIAQDIARAGVTVVSGAADGIDISAHFGAMKTGRTIAVLGSGLAIQSSNKQRLINKILENGGLVMSEYSPTVPANKGTFPHRNRIIAGLSVGVVVIEAGKKSGALNTAQHAGNYGRQVFAVPGSVYMERSYGCNELIRDGAILVKDANDILNECKIKSENGLEKAVTIGLEPLEGKEEAVCKLIPMDNAISAEELSMQLEDIEINELNSILFNLEIKDYISIDDAGNYIRLYGNY